MSELQENNDLKPEQSWLKAEQMLDRHFRKKRTVIWLLSIVTIGLVIVCSTLIIGRYHATEPVQHVNSGAEKNTQDVAPLKPAVIDDQKKEGRGNLEERVKSQESGIKKQELRVQNQESINKSQESKFKSQESGIKNQETGNRNQEFGSKKLISGDVTLNINRDVDRKKKDYSKKLSVNNAHVKPESEMLISHSGTEAKEISETLVQHDATSNVRNQKDDAGATENNSAHQDVYSPKVIPMISIPFIQFPIASANMNVVSHKTDDLPISVLCGTNVRFQLLLYGSAQYVFKHLDSKNFKPYVDRRKNEEEGIVTSSMGAALSAEVKKFMISVGIEYASWGEKNVYSPYLNQQHVIAGGNWQTNYRSSVDTDTTYIYGNQYFLYRPVQVLDSTFNATTDTVLKSTYNQQVSSVNGISKFYFIEVPVEVSVRFSRGKIGVGATIGFSPAWLVSEKGYYLTRDLSGIESVAEIKSTRQFMMNGRFSLDLYYQLNDRINFVARPQFRTNLSSIFKNDYDVNQRYYSAGLLFGLQYHLK